MQTTPPLTDVAGHPTPMLGNMTIQRMDNVGVVVDDLEAAIAFFVELGMELEGEAPVEGRWVDRIVGLDDVRVDIAMISPRAFDGRLMDAVTRRRPGASNSPSSERDPEVWLDECSH
jgi:catechol 2,3-dioxygenase-like lactoylglutathione lyase family enzyme